MMSLNDKTILHQRRHRTVKKVLAILILIGICIGWLSACAEEKAPFIKNSGTEKETSSYKINFASDSGSPESESESEFDLYGVDFPVTGFLTVMTGDEILTITISVFSEENDLPEVYCRSRSEAFEIFHTVLEQYTCDELLDSDPETVNRIKLSLIQALETHYTELTEGKEAKITDLVFEVESCR